MADGIRAGDLLVPPQAIHGKADTRLYCSECRDVHAAPECELPIPRNVKVTSGWGIAYEPNGGFRVVYPTVETTVESTVQLETRRYKFDTYTLLVEDIIERKVLPDGREELQTLSGRVIVVSNKWTHVEVLPSKAT
jgi:hypothetical protein